MRENCEIFENYEICEIGEKCKNSLKRVKSDK